MIKNYVNTPSQREPVRKIFTRPQLNHFILILMWFLLRDATAWNFTSQLSINAQNYPQVPVDVTRQIVTVAHSVTNGIPRGQTFRLQVLAPPGVTTVAITAQSNNWQCAPDSVTGSPSPLRCPIMGGFDHNPGEFCNQNPSASKPTPCGNGTFVYPQDLHTVTARLSDILYPTESTSPQVTTEPRYVYFVLYQQPQASSDFYFGSNLGITFGISDVQSYTQWRNARPWAGGPLENSLDGIGEVIVPSNEFTLTIISATNGSVTSSPTGIQCGGTMGTANCNANYIANTLVTLTAIAQAGSRFVNWSNGCGDTDNVTSLTMNSNKICSATFEKIPENPPEIELFDGGNHLSDGSPTPIQFGSTTAGNPVTKTLTIQNIGTGNLNLTNLTLPMGFSLIGNLPSLIPASSSVLITIQFDAIAQGTYNGNLKINNNDADENPFDLVVEGTVVEFDKFDLNEGKQEFGNQGTAFFSDKVKIVVTANLENENGVFEPLTREDKLKVTANRSVDINAIITPDPIHQFIDIVIVAGWDNQEQTYWYQKTPTSTLLDNTGWVEWTPDLSKLHVIPYGTYAGRESYPVNVFTGKLVPPPIEGLDQAKQVNFFIGYGVWVAATSPADPPEGRFIYVVSQPITFQLPVPLTPAVMEIKVNEFKVISPQAGSEGKITSCQISNEEIATVSFDNNSFACGLFGLKQGSTLLTIQGANPNSTAVTTINVVE